MLFTETYKFGAQIQPVHFVGIEYSPSETWLRGMSVGGSFPAGVGPGSPSRDAAN